MPDKTTLSDVGIFSQKIFDHIESFAPESTKQKATPTIAPSKKTSSAANKEVKKTPQPTLGPLDVGRWLSAYNVAYNTKSDGQGTWYRLDNCLFDPNHTKNESAFIQYVSGKVIYHCSHDSCNHTYHDAWPLISGEDHPRRFCAGYDPDWTPPKTRGPVPDPEREYVTYGGKTGKAHVNPVLFAEAVEAHYHPLMFDAIKDVFLRYRESGVWVEISKEEINRQMLKMLGSEAKQHIITETLFMLETRTLVTQEETFANPYYLNLLNGMLNIKTMQLTPHSPAFHSRLQMAVNYQPDAACDLWLTKALAEIFRDDLTKTDVLMQFFGYCLYPKIMFPCAVFQIGGGGNGKGVVEEVLIAMLGENNVSHISMERMQKPFGPIEIKDKLLNACGETEAAPLDVTNFKTLAAGGLIQAEVKYRSDVSFRAIAKHMISMNAFPGLKEKTPSFFRRVIVMEYKQKFEGPDMDVHLVSKLLEEIDGIFMWALDGLQMVMENEEIITPESVDAAKERFREATNPVILFLNECCTMGDQYSVPRADVWTRYKAWYEDTGGSDRYRFQKKNFYEQVRLNVAVRMVRRGTKDHWVGMELIDPIGYEVP